MTSTSRRAADYERGNIRSARLILESPERYGGEDSGVCRWAQMVLARDGAECSAETAVMRPGPTGRTGGASQRALDFEGAAR